MRIIVSSLKTPMCFSFLSVQPYFNTVAKAIGRLAYYMLALKNAMETSMNVMNPAFSNGAYRLL